MEIRLEDVLARDPVAESEKLFGNVNPSNGPVDRVAGLGFLAHAMTVNAQKNAALELLDDTMLSNDLSRYQRIVGEIGFRKVLEIPFGGRMTPEKYFVYFRDQGGLLLSFDTYEGNRVNSGKVYYNWRRKPGDVAGHYECLSSGGWRYESFEEEQRIRAIDPPYAVYDKARDEGDVESQTAIARYKAEFAAHSVWVGDHDAREALRHNLTRLDEYGLFVTPWIEQPFLWLLHYGDKDESDNYKQINAERMAMLPSDGRQAVKAT
jgi:hypothetical protein